MPKPRRGVHLVPVRPVQPSGRPPRWGLSRDARGADTAALLALALMTLARSRSDPRAAPAEMPSPPPAAALPTASAGSVWVQQLSGTPAPAGRTVWHDAPHPAAGSGPAAATTATVAASARPVSGSSGRTPAAAAGRSAEPDLPVVAGGQISGIATLAEALTGRRVRLLAEGPGGQVRGVLAAVVGNLLILCDDDRVIWVNLPDVQAIATGPGVRAGHGAGGGSGGSPHHTPYAPARGAEVDMDTGPIVPEHAGPMAGSAADGLPDPPGGEIAGESGTPSAGSDAGPRSGAADTIARVLWPPPWELVSVFRVRK